MDIKQRTFLNVDYFAGFVFGEKRTEVPAKEDPEVVAARLLRNDPSTVGFHYTTQVEGQRALQDGRSYVIGQAIPGSDETVTILGGAGTRRLGPNDVLIPIEKLRAKIREGSAKTELAV